ncbi:hypothetical protein [Candidatus Endomicrobiellum pyrsonymphae]|uniref:hypothetical protein n=1 Tax=Candidatus Endomicrobiellum pyrsonymphae TaxID=1408203 RepID=UPI0035A91AFA
MGCCVSCLFQDGNSLDEKGSGVAFCMVKKKWSPKNESCKSFTELCGFKQRNT